MLAPLTPFAAASTGWTHLRAALCACAALAVCGQALDAEQVALPSGQSVTFVEALLEQDPAVLRMRYLAPALAQDATRPDFDALTADLEFLCISEGLPVAAQQGLSDVQIVVSLSAEPVEFGVMSPEIAQVFEAFRPENGTCMLEMF